MIFGCIDNSLRSLGESVASSILYQIEKKYQFPKEEFASRPLEFIGYLRQFLGASGSSVIERMIAKQIISAFKLAPTLSSSSVEEVIAEAKRDFLTR